MLSEGSEWLHARERHPVEPKAVVRVGSRPGLEGEHLYKTLRCPRDGTTLRLPLRCDHKRTCAVCYRSWVWQEAGKVTWRLESVFSRMRRRLGGLKPRHVTVSLIKDHAVNTAEEYDNLFRRAWAVLRRMGAQGGVGILHRDRCGDTRGREVAEMPPSAHYHWVGWGNVDSERRPEGVVVKMIRAVAPDPTSSR